MINHHQTNTNNIILDIAIQIKNFTYEETKARYLDDTGYGVIVNNNNNLNNISNLYDTSNNSNNNSTYKQPMILKVLIAFACIIVILLSLLGNALVVSVILRFKRLKNATNYILLSLAIADITVTFLVMIPAMIQDVIQKWIFNQIFCKFYNAFDITCCTASILHLLLVAIDRYIAIFRPLTYREMVRKWHIFVAVFFVWTLSLCMSFIPIFLGWNRIDKGDESVNSSSIIEVEISNTTSQVDNSDVCALEANIPYAIISSSLSFFIPLVIMTLVYLRIYIIAKRQANAIAQIEIRARNFSRDLSNSNFANNHNDSITTPNGGDLLNDQQLIKINNILTQNGQNAVARNSDDKTERKSRFLKVIKQLKTIERKRTKDTKAIKTLGIIMGIFILCWLPFFYMYLSIPLTNRPFPLIVERLITWIGYINSFINPIIYALTNKDFRKSYISTLKTVSFKICPSKVHKSLFGHKEEYFTANNQNFKNNRIANNRRNNDKNRLCNFLMNLNCFSSSSLLNNNNNNNNNNKKHNLSISSNASNSYSSNSNKKKLAASYNNNNNNNSNNSMEKRNSLKHNNNSTNQDNNLSDIYENDKESSKIFTNEDLNNLVYIDNEGNTTNNDCKLNNSSFDSQISSKSKNLKSSFLIDKEFKNKNENNYANNFKSIDDSLNNEEEDNDKKTDDGVSNKIDFSDFGNNSSSNKLNRNSSSYSTLTGNVSSIQSEILKRKNTGRTIIKFFSFSKPNSKLGNIHKNPGVNKENILLFRI